MAFSKIIGASVADDAIDVSDLGTIMSVGESAPSSPFVGQRWYRASTAITYQYTNDGTSSFWNIFRTFSCLCKKTTIWI